MDSNREAKLKMYHSVIDLCENNLAIVALVIAFQTSYNIFKTTVTAIVAGAADLEAQTGGYSTSKKTAKKNLATMGSGIAGMVYAYASVIEDEALQEAMSITASDIIRAMDDEVGAICTNIYKAANDNLANLGDYGVTAPLLATYQTAINDFADKSSKPKQSKNYKIMVRNQVKNMEKDADKVLKKQMDKLVVNFKSNGNAAFEGQYHAARVIIDPGSFTTVLKILVVNGANNQPLKNVKCYRDDSVTVKRSSNKGLITYKNIEEGGHSFVLKHKLFQDLAVNGVMMSHGEKKTVKAMMVPVNDNNSGITIVREVDVPSMTIVNIPVNGINGTPLSTLLIEITGAPLRFYAAANATDGPGAVYYDAQIGQAPFNLDAFKIAIGYGPGKQFVNVQNMGAVAAHFILTFSNLAP